VLISVHKRASALHRRRMHAIYQFQCEVFWYVPAVAAACESFLLCLVACHIVYVC
jgi:hypothetical protein